MAKKDNLRMLILATAEFSDKPLVLLAQYHEGYSSTVFDTLILGKGSIGKIGFDAI